MDSPVESRGAFPPVETKIWVKKVEPEGWAAQHGVKEGFQLLKARDGRWDLVIVVVCHVPRWVQIPKVIVLASKEEEERKRAYNVLALQ